MEKYYEAYDRRYLQVHAQGLRWFADTPTPIVEQILKRYCRNPEPRILELGCGEGRDAFPLLDRGYDLLATDISPEAIRSCREQCPEYAQRFQVLDCVAGALEETFDAIYAVAVVHMLVEQQDRDAFYRFVRSHLKPGGVGLICTMGDGRIRRKTDPERAFDLQQRIHTPSGLQITVTNTSCRMVDFPEFLEELSRNGLSVREHGVTSSEPDFPCLMYAVVEPAP